MTNDLIHQPDDDDALASPEASRRASNVAKDLRKRAKEKGVSVEALFRPISSETSQATFYRRIGPDDLIEVGSHRKTTQGPPSPQDDGNKQKQLPIKLISLLAACAPAVADVDPDELRAEMLGRGTSNNPELLLIVYGSRHRDTAETLKAMDLKLKEYDATATEIISWQREFPLRDTASNMLPGILKGKLRDGIINSEEVTAKQKYGDDRSLHFLNNFDRGKTRSRFGISLPSIEDIPDRKGPYRYVKRENIGEFCDEYGNDSIKGMEVELLVLKKELTPAMQSYFDQWHGVYAIDGNLLILTERDGITRTYLERTGNPQRDRLLDDELAKARELLTQLAFDPTKANTLELLKKIADQADHDSEAIRAKEHALKEAKWKPKYYQRPVRRVDL